MFLIASYPRSGNHLVRFFVEYLTGRPTLGCYGNPEDVPVCNNTFPGADPLAHVCGEAIGQKVHSAHEIDLVVPGMSIDGVVLIVRAPVEAILSHEDKRPAVFYLRYLHRLRGGAKQYFALIRRIEQLNAAVLTLRYEKLTSSNVDEATAEFDRLVRFLNLHCLSERVHELRLNLAPLRALNARAGNRSWGGIRSAFDPTFYAAHADKVTLRFTKMWIDHYARALRGLKLHDCASQSLSLPWPSPTADDPP
ncbi:MAG TPA: hypothetical protein VFL96_13715 [Acidobacteriaceae bacterium]|nr:hypothetical protein [Acidobacteriaceae bacterium]